jgi:hypothetical protein
MQFLPRSFPHCSAALEAIALGVKPEREHWEWNTGTARKLAGQKLAARAARRREREKDVLASL